MSEKDRGSSLVTGHVPTHPSPEASPDPNPTLTQTLDLTQGRVSTWPATEQEDRQRLSWTFLSTFLPVNSVSPRSGAVLCTHYGSLWYGLTCQRNQSRHTGWGRALLEIASFYILLLQTTFSYSVNLFCQLFRLRLYWEIRGAYSCDNTRNSWHYQANNRERVLSVSSIVFKVYYNEENSTKDNERRYFFWEGHRGNTTSHSLPLLSVGRHGPECNLVKVVKFHIECKFHFPCAHGCDKCIELT